MDTLRICQTFPKLIDPSPVDFKVVLTDSGAWRQTPLWVHLEQTQTRPHLHGSGSMHSSSTQQRVFAADDLQPKNVQKTKGGERDAVFRNSSGTVDMP